MAFFLESRRPVLEQLELYVNSHVCGIEAVVRASFENDKERFAHQKESLYAGVEGIAGGVSIQCSQSI